MTGLDGGWRATGDRVLVQPLAPADATATGIAIPDEVRDRPQRGIVLLVGPGLQGEPPPAVEVGELVLYGRYAGVAEELEGRPVVMMRADEVLVARAVSDAELAWHVDRRGRQVVHLASERCVSCPEDPADVEARARLQAMREELRIR